MASCPIIAGLPGSPTAGDDALTVYYDGACPLCRREIDFYRRRPGAERIRWDDVSASRDAMVAPDLRRADALARFHVRLPDGRLADGARGFAALWEATPGFALLGRIARAPLVAPLMELGYRAFLTLRPAMQTFLQLLEPRASRRYPSWLERELRSDHAGESGAVAIYRGILAVSRAPEVRAFAEQHTATERRHLELMNEIVDPGERSALLPLWRAAGFVTGALPAVFGPQAVFATIDAVETFVDGHYRQQVDALEEQPRWQALRDVLERCRRDEVEHRDDARRRARSEPGPVLRLWLWSVAVGSDLGVAVARRF